MLLMWQRENPKVSLKIKYKKNLELALIISLALHTLMFMTFKKFDKSQETIIPEQDVQIELTDIPQTQQIKRLPPPARPVIPIASEDEDIFDDVTIEDTEIDFAEIPAPPPPPSPPEDEKDETPIFIVWDEPPMPIGGYEEIIKNLVYPDLARKAGIAGMVVIQAIIDENGNIIECIPLKTLGNNGTTEAAVKAIRSVKWTPAKHRDRAVKVRINIPVRFLLRNKGISD